MAVVDPNSDWGKRPSARDDEVQIPITIYIAGDDTQSASLGENAKGAETNPSREIKNNPVLEAVGPPTLCPNHGEVRTAVTVQIGNDTTLVAEGAAIEELHP